MTFLESLLILLGRICISAYFFLSIADKAKHWQRTLTFMKSKNVPKANIVLPITMGIKVLGSLMILVGFVPRLGALLLVLIMVPSVIRFHDFWAMHGEEKHNEMKTFMKEVAIIGGLLLLVAVGAGSFAISRT